MTFDGRQVLARAKPLQPGGRLKPGQPLARVVPFPARVVPLRRGSGLEPSGIPERRVRIRPVSPKRARENRERKAMIAQTFGGERPLCAVWGAMQPGWCGRWADDAHEPLSRARGGSITDPANCVPLCRPCHTLITDQEPQWAYDLGLLVHSWGPDAGDAA